LAIARRFEGAKGVRAVLYPGLKSHAGHEIAARQMSGGFGGMLSLCIEGGEEAAMAVAARLKLIKRATSLGGVESLVEHRASVEGAGTPCPPDLLRLSIGIENANDLTRDIDQALDGRNR
jgi:cystathionine gamma-synthase